MLDPATDFGEVGAELLVGGLLGLDGEGGLLGWGDFLGDEVDECAGERAGGLYLAIDDGGEVEGGLGVVGEGGVGGGGALRVTHGVK